MKHKRGYYIVPITVNCIFIVVMGQWVNATAQWIGFVWSICLALAWNWAEQPKYETVIREGATTLRFSEKLSDEKIEKYRLALRKDDAP